MFEGEKTLIFWVGLIILGLASVGLFSVLWMLLIYYMYSYQHTSVYMTLIPLIVGAVLFLIIGLYMMKHGVKTTE